MGTKYQAKRDRSKNGIVSDTSKKKEYEKVRKNDVDRCEALPPVSLICCIFVCSGFLWILGFRDMMATGKSLFGAMDDAMLAFTQSTYWFDDSRGPWKSTAGGLSTVARVTTDENKMGHLFIRKLSGAAAMGVHGSKLAPFLFVTRGTQWEMGHYHPTLVLGSIGNIFLALFQWTNLEELRLAKAERLAYIIIGVLTFEASVILFYVTTSKQSPPKKMSKPRKSPRAITNRIVARTVLMVSGMVCIIFGRDLFSPGHILPIPRDDIYLEWTGAFLHSPPVGSVEYRENADLAALYVGDKYASGQAAAHMLVNAAIYKIGAALCVRYGTDGRGEIQCRTLWRGQVFAGVMVIVVYRVFASASVSASLDFRWHLMCLVYETFILGLYAYL